MLVFLSVIVTFALFATQISGQQFSCTQQAQFSMTMDNQFTSVTCSNGQDLGDRCPGCCQAWAMNQGVSASQSVGFINDGGNGCVCCGFGIGTAVAAADIPGGAGSSGPNRFRVQDRQPQPPVRLDSVPMAMAFRRRP